MNCGHDGDTDPHICPTGETCTACGHPIEWVHCAAPYKRHTGSNLPHADWVNPHPCPTDNDPPGRIRPGCEEVNYA